MRLNYEGLELLLSPRERADSLPVPSQFSGTSGVQILQTKRKGSCSVYESKPRAESEIEETQDTSGETAFLELEKIRQSFAKGLVEVQMTFLRKALYRLLKKSEDPKLFESQRVYNFWDQIEDLTHKANKLNRDFVFDFSFEKGGEEGALKVPFVLLNESIQYMF